ncbi:hypothetical protein HD554DRAFT_2015495, partial [Boletus coccyginus]
ILIVKSGQHSHNLPCHVQPCRYLENLVPNSTTISFHIAKPSPYLNEHTAVVPCGQNMGGGSTVNCKLYAPLLAFYLTCSTEFMLLLDTVTVYDALGNKGWSFNKVLPLIRKLEMFTLISDRSTHDYSGLIKISTNGFDLEIGSQFLNVARQYDSACPVVNDNNNFRTTNMYSVDVFSSFYLVGSECGCSLLLLAGLQVSAHDTASRYLYPHSGNPNIMIIVGKHVKCIIIENGHAISIKYTSDAISCPWASGKLVTVKATKLIVVSGGAFESLFILERSGIGIPSVLKKNKISVLVDLPGIGQNYQGILAMLECSCFGKSQGLL